MGPLEGIRVLDLGRFQACPLCGMLLADMGADVIRIEQPEGAPDRTWGQLGPDGETLLYKIVSRNKKGITLRLDTAEGIELFHELVKRSDVVIHNFTPSAPAAAEVSYSRLKEINASIIVAAVSGYGQNGPDAENPCFDAVAQARSGGMLLDGFPGDPPIKTTVTYIDGGTGMLAALGIMFAIYHREKTGMGQAIDVSLFDTAFFATQCLGTLLLYTLYGEIRKQVGHRGFNAYIGCFKAKDKWIMVAPATDGIWKRFLKAIGRSDLGRDPNFAHDMNRFKNGALIDQIVGEWAEQRNAEEIVGIMQKARIPCTVINTVDQLLTDPQVEARKMIRYLDYPQIGKIPVPGIPINLSLTPGAIKTPAPNLGGHNEEIYCGLLGLGSEKVSILREKGII